MDKELKCLKVEFTDGSEEILSNVFVATVSSDEDGYSVKVFTDTDKQEDVMAFKLTMLNDLRETGMIKAAADDGKLDEEIKERAAALLSRFIAHTYVSGDFFPCSICKNNVLCGEGLCDMYDEDEDGFSCIDEPVGECRRMKGTPCEGCMDKDFEKFCLKPELLKDKN